MVKPGTAVTTHGALVGAATTIALIIITKNIKDKDKVEASTMFATIAIPMAAILSSAFIPKGQLNLPQVGGVPAKEIRVPFFFPYLGAV